jgi:phosphohistidine phosphatase SixA
MKKQNLYYVVSLILVLMVFSVGIGFFLGPKKTDIILIGKGKEASNLMVHWSQGNVIAAIRHAERCDRSDNQCLDGEEGITVPGMEMSIGLGNDFKTLFNLDNTKIYNSPSKRTSQTANFMFGKASTDGHWLGDCKGDLLENIFDYMDDGKNTVLITHYSCIKSLIESAGGELINLDEESNDSYGVTVFFAADKHEKQIHALGYLFPDDWVKAISHKVSPER